MVRSCVPKSTDLRKVTDEGGRDVLNLANAHPRKVPRAAGSRWRCPMGLDALTGTVVIAAAGGGTSGIDPRPVNPAPVRLDISRSRAESQAGGAKTATAWPYSLLEPRLGSRKGWRGPWSGSGAQKCAKTNAKLSESSIWELHDFRGGRTKPALNVWYTLRQEAGIGDFRFHDLRIPL